MQTTNILLKGVTRVPDDTACENGELAIAVNLAADGDGLKMLEQPQPVADGVIAEVNSSDVFTAGGLTLASGEEVLCVHQNDGYKHYITKYTYTDNGTTHVALCWWGVEDYTTTEGGQSVTKKAWRRHIIGDTNANQATVMGNTIITQGTVMEYWLWDKTLNSNAGDYKKLNDKPPMVLMRFGLESELEVYPGYSSSNKPSDPIDICGWISRDDIEMPYINTNSSSQPNYHLKASEVLPQSLIDLMDDNASINFDSGLSPITSAHITEMKQRSPELHNYTFENAISKRSESESGIDAFVELMTNKVMSYINKFITKKATDEGKFVFPFYVRYCYELYDGSQMMASNPVLLVPNSRAPVFIVNGDNQMNSNTWSNNQKIPSCFSGGLTVELDGNGGDYEKTSIAINGRVWGFISRLKYLLYAPGMYTRSGATITQSEDWTNWKDLIKSIGIYITPGIYTYDQAGKVYGWKNMEDDGAWDSYFTEGVVKQKTNPSDAWEGRTRLIDCLYGTEKDQHYNNLWSNNWLCNTATDPDTYSEHTGAPWCIMRVPEKSLADIRKTAIETMQFYKVAEIPYEDLLNNTTLREMDSVSSNVPIQGSTLSTLTNRKQLVDGDYVQFDKISAESQYVYNRRLHIANVSREYAQPADPSTQVPIVNAGPSYYVSEAVMINNSITTKTSARMVVGNLRPLFVYYPKKDARKAIFRWGGDGADCTAYSLIEHPILNGSYWLSPDIWTESENANERVDVLPPADSEGDIIDDDDIVVTFPTATDPEVEHLYGEVWTSNVENPFVFQAANVNQVGDGVIKALRAAVAPLAEDQHGYAPMYVFTSQGVWAMTFSKDGTPAAIDHICGDIITEGSEPLSVGQSCLMMSGRGLLELHGRSVRNLSAKIDGRFASSLRTDYAQYGNILQAAGFGFFNQSFLNDLNHPLRGIANCKMSFDYKHQRVYVWLGHGAWVLNLRTGLWTHSQQTISQVFNAYPSCEFVGAATTLSPDSLPVLTLDGDGTYGTGVVTTRPIKLGEWQQKIREVAVRGFINPDLGDVYNSSGVWTGSEAQVWTALHGSRNWHSYGLVADSMCDRLTRLGGSGYRSHVVSVILRDSSATVDRLVISHDTEQGDRLR